MTTTISVSIDVPILVEGVAFHFCRVLQRSLWSWVCLLQRARLDQPGPQKDSHA